MSSRSHFFATVSVMAILGQACSLQETRNYADLILTGGTIHTMNDSAPAVEAVAVRDDRIIFVGTEAEALELKGDSTDMISVQGRTLIPGFIESHGHFVGLGYDKTILDLRDTKTFDELLELVRQAAASSQPGDWIVGRGWHQDKWMNNPGDWIHGMPHHLMLSKAAPQNPVWLRHVSGHAALANARAMEIAGVTRSQIVELNRDHPGGSIVCFPDGRPTGLFMENAMDIIDAYAPGSQSPGQLPKYLEAATRECQAHGITSFDDAGEPGEVISEFQKLKDEARLGVRMYVMISGSDDTLVRDWLNRGPLIDSTKHMLTIRSIKLYADGALGNRGAWLLEPYSDRPGYYGIPRMDMNGIYETSAAALQHGFQVCVHAIGDRANREVLDQYERAFREFPGEANDARFRIEHAQHLNAADIPRFAELGVIASMQAIHMSSDRPWAIDRLGQERINEGAYVWQKLLQSGARVINGTDVPVEPVSPIACFYASVTRKTLAGTPEGGYEPGQKMTRQQALRSYTLDAAYGTFEEDEKGSIEVGKLADFAVLDRDIMRIPEEEILSTHVVMTILGGRIVYERP